MAFTPFLQAELRLPVTIQLPPDSLAGQDLPQATCEGLDARRWRIPWGDRQAEFGGEWEK